MGSGDHKHLLNVHLNGLHFHLHHSHHDHHRRNDEIPKGCVAVVVGQEGEEQQRFVVPLMYINHPLFMTLLKEAEEEYGFDQKGPINIPCHVEEFRHVQGMIDEENTHHHLHHHLLHVGCFSV